MVTIPTSAEPITVTSRDLVNTTWYRFFSEIGKISPFMQTVLDDQSPFAALGTLGITYSSYTPTLTNTTNLDATTASTTRYFQIGNLVVAFGLFGADPTVAAASTVMGMSLPVASTFASAADLGGVAAGPVDPGAARMIADTANNRVIVSWISGGTTNVSFGFIFGYIVI